MQKSKVTFLAVMPVGPGVIPPPLLPGALGFTDATSKEGFDTVSCPKTTDGTSITRIHSSVRITRFPPLSGIPYLRTSIQRELSVATSVPALQPPERRIAGMVECHHSYGEASSSAGRQNASGCGRTSGHASGPGPTHHQ